MECLGSKDSKHKDFLVGFLGNNLIFSSSIMAILRNLPAFLIVFLVCLSQFNSQLDEIQILLSIKSGLRDSTNAFQGWESSAASPCKWNGITCNTAGSVTEINLENNGLSGPIPSSAICSLKALTSIQLGNNSLHGNIPDGQWINCSQLETLNLTSNLLTGTLPDFSALRSLKSLGLSENKFSEYAYTYKVSETSDVYSFGVVLMELVTGRRPIEPEFGENEGIVGWISRNIATRDSTLEVIDSRIPEIYKQRMTKVLKIAALCTDHLPALRPSMRVVVDLLLKADPFPRSS
uniref:Protein kinase domain-containing protein n=1 Tax=Picea sitchensis TaxID=3332 RepID=A9P1G6_PICSI|nr:unknown [Picea sitchensis]